jgi:hypothetical protein
MFKRMLNKMREYSLVFNPFIFNIFFNNSLTLRLGGGKKKKKFKNILFFPLFGSLSMREWKGMERPFHCLGV